MSVILREQELPAKEMGLIKLGAMLTGLKWSIIENLTLQQFNGVILARDVYFKADNCVNGKYLQD